MGNKVKRRDNPAQVTVKAEAARINLDPVDGQSSRHRNIGEDVAEKNSRPQYQD